MAVVENGEYGVKSVEVGGRLLQALVRKAGPVGLTELARMVGMPPAKAHRYMVSLKAIGMVEQDAHSHQYFLGRFAIEVGAVAASVADPIADAIDRLWRVANQIDETLTLSIWTSNGPLVIEVKESSHRIAMTMKRGIVLPLVGTATGVVFCAYLQPAQTRHLIDLELSEFSNSNPIAKSRDELESVCELARSQGYFYNEGHFLKDVVALAVPIFDGSKRLVATLAAFGSKDNIDPKLNGKVLQSLLLASR